MSERDDFLEWVRTTLTDAERRLHDGDATPRRAIWTRREPVTVFGARRTAVGPKEVGELSTMLGQSFSDVRSFELELVAADVSGDPAYTVAYEYSSTSVNGVPRTYQLRVTQVYRREDGQWKVFHRHADEVPAPSSAP